LRGFAPRSPERPSRHGSGSAYKLRKVTGPTGTPRFVAESDAAGHADRTWACFLAINATDGPSGPVMARSRHRREAGHILEGF
ncbi:hypothetical protein O5853_30890, partial [Escherichia coli]|nr:hypothetical protein [Escherichia coli]